MSATDDETLLLGRLETPAKITRTAGLADLFSAQMEALRLIDGHLVQNGYAGGKNPVMDIFAKGLGEYNLWGFVPTEQKDRCHAAMLVHPVKLTDGSEWLEAIVFVKPEYRMNGCARRLLTLALREARAAHLSGLLLRPDTDSVLQKGFALHLKFKVHHLDPCKMYRGHEYTNYVRVLRDR